MTPPRTGPDTGGAPASQLYLYGFSASHEPAMEAALEGLAGVTPFAPTAARIAGRSVIVGLHDGSEILQTRRRMLAHTRVLEAAMAVAPILPMRFGLVARDIAALEALLEAHRDRIDRQFEAIGTQIEIGLRIGFPRDAALEAVVARDTRIARERLRLAGRGAEAHFDRIDLGRRVAETLERRRTDAQRDVLRAISAHCGSVVLKLPEEDVEVLRAECLLEPEGLADLARAAEAAASACDFAPGAEPRIRIVGPVPPFHFVDLALGTDGAGCAWA